MDCITQNKILTILSTAKKHVSCQRSAAKCLSRRTSNVSRVPSIFF